MSLPQSRIDEIKRMIKDDHTYVDIAQRFPGTALTHGKEIMQAIEQHAEAVAEYRREGCRPNRP